MASDGDSNWRSVGSTGRPGITNSNESGRSGGGNWRGGGSSQRRTATDGSDAKMKDLSLNDKPAGDAANGSEPQESKDTEKSRRREPATVNSRAAAFGSAPDYRPSESGPRRTNRGPRLSEGPPPVRNARFEKMAEEERSMNNRRGPPQTTNSRFAVAAEADRSRPEDRERERGPPPVANSRFAAAAEADRSRYDDRDRERGPPPVANSRFAAAAEADRSSFDDRDRERGPPPVANSRFAAAAEADRSRYDDRDRERGPPPVANSRFAAAAEADRSRYDDRGPPPERNDYRDRGPPPQVTNSRFAAAAAMSEADDREREERRRERYGNRDGGYMGRDDRRGPLPQSSRFAAAVAADGDYTDRESRGFGGGGGRFADRGPRGGFQDYSRPLNRFSGPPPEPEKPTRVDELLKPKKTSEDEAVLQPQTAEHAANMLSFPAKALTRDNDEENFLSAPKKEEVAEQEPVEPAPEAAEESVEIAQVSADKVEAVLKEFINGGKQGDDLKAWCESVQATLPTVEKLMYGLLTEVEKLNPDPDCAWAEPDKYGSAFLSLVEDNLFNQMQVLWAIQKYCDDLGFPKLDGESVVQSMFRSMYKYDLAEADAFMEWKEDESDVHEKGKMTAIIQTVEWFNWLEEDDDEEEDEEEEEVEEDEY